MKWRRACLEDVTMLGRLNFELIQDEGHSNPMSVAQLEDRMRRWISSEYTAILFTEDDEVLGYALFRDNEGRGVLLRQFFVCRARRRQGVGRRAIGMLVAEILPPGTSVIVEVLSANTRALAFWGAVDFVDYGRILRRLPEGKS